MDLKQSHIELVVYGREERHLEYKGTLDFATEATKAVLTRCIAAHTNIRDGGVIIVGMEKDGETYKRTGLKPEHIESIKTDDIRDYVMAHLTPTPNFTIDVGTFENNTFVIISVSPFTRYPSVCVRGYREPDAKRPTLTQGVIYIRSKRKPESMPLQTLEDLEDMIDMATDQWMQYRARRDVAAGYVSPEDSRRRFDAEGADL